MNILQQLAVSTMITISAGAFAAPTDFFVSPSGSDDNPGTEALPFATLQRASEAAKSAREPATIYLRDGIYRLSEPVKIEGLDSIAIKAYPGETPVLSGSVPVTGWKKVRDRSILKKVGKDAAAHLYVSDLRKQGLEDFGDAIKQGNRPLLYLDGEEQMLARYPDSGFIYGGKALGETLIPTVANGNSGAVEGIFEYLDPRVGRWADEKDAKVGGYWFWDWDDAYYSVKEIDVERRSMRVSKDKGFRHGLRFFGLNLLCETDSPGEWYLDREEGKLYWYAPECADPSREVPATTISMLRSRFMLCLENCTRSSVEGLTFEESRGGAVSIKGGEACSVIACRMEDLGTEAMVIKGGFCHKVDGCVLRHLGAGGVTITGGDRKTLTHARHEMSNTLVEDWERFKRTYNGAFSGEGCGIHLHHCEFRDAPSSAFSLAGNDLVAEFNIIDNVARESDDQGGFDLYLNPSMRGIIMRYNYWKDIRGGTRYGVGGIRLDDLITGVQIYGNVFERCGSIEFGGVQIHGGSENLIEDNLFFDCPFAVSFTPYGEEEWRKTYATIQHLMHEEVEIDSPEYLLRYPEIREFGRNIDVNIVRNNLLVDCGSLYFHATVPQIESNNVQLRSEGRSISSFCTPEVLHPLGIKTIPISEMGIISNKWIGK